MSLIFERRNYAVFWGEIVLQLGAQQHIRCVCVRWWLVGWGFQSKSPLWSNSQGKWG